ncbi:6-pyruvoyl tetrahydropterin synthase [Beggiatoa sp. PS]|nr:6-pyruvoyl tetrahydropterin synthase [Beggiatoa sp. PS]
MNMYKIIVKIKYEYAHRLLHHTGKCRHVHGHSGEAIIELASNTLNDNGFVMDFADVKTPLKKWINQFWDHAYLANESDPLLPAFKSENMNIYTFPEEPTAEVMARHLFEQAAILERPPGVILTRVTIRETCTGQASYQPKELEIAYEI